MISVHLVPYKSSQYTFQAIEDLCKRAHHRPNLLQAIWATYSLLWNEALHITFDPEVVAIMHVRDKAIQREQTLLEQLQVVDVQNREMNLKSNELVKNNLENLFLKKQTGQDMAKIQGQVTSLTLANEDLAARMISLEDDKNSMQVCLLGLLYTHSYRDQSSLYSH